MIQPSKRQGQIWQAALNSQKVSVIWEASDVDLSQMLSRIQETGFNPPDLLLIDVGVLSCNPYAFCRWCREHHPDQKIILTNVSQREISPPERQWAMYQGALDLLPGFQRETLLTGVTSALTRVLTAMDGQQLNQESLINVLFSITSLQHSSKPRNTPPPTENSSTGQETPVPAPPRKVIPNQLVQSPGQKPSAPDRIAPVPLIMEEASASPAAAFPEAIPGDKGEENRRSYRGVVY
ncbi:hypothetical protein BST81_06000 [Leptolyngbya sp. 'hensonii']|nr:hypothetical protein BST81_06000 [Leptolyngbya sp. 'hensonii']